jgi:hypothetical protein
MQKREDLAMASKFPSYSARKGETADQLCEYLAMLAYMLRYVLVKTRNTVHRALVRVA